MPAPWLYFEKLRGIERDAGVSREKKRLYSDMKCCKLSLGPVKFECLLKKRLQLVIASAAFFVLGQCGPECYENTERPNKVDLGKNTNERTRNSEVV
jgi:hypothetical protein